MADKDLADSQATAAAPVGQDVVELERLDNTIGASFNGGRKTELLAVFEGFGWDQSKGIRTICLAFLESAKVRDAVIGHLLKRAA